MVLLVLVMNPFDVWQNICGCVETCNGGRDVERGFCVVYINCWITFLCVWKMCGKCSGFSTKLMYMV